MGSLMPTLYAVGFDPGGHKAFGWAVVRYLDGIVSLTSSGTCSNALDAVTATQRACPTEPLAFAVDAPLFWIPSGDRNVDKIVRRMVCSAGGTSGTVSHVNSLRGACLVQGIIVTDLAAKLWPRANVSEAHPKALLKVNSAARDFADKASDSAATEHERDAALAAFTAISHVLRFEGWHDLAMREHGHHFPAGKPVAYWFPQESS